MLTRRQKGGAFRVLGRLMSLPSTHSVGDFFSSSSADKSTSMKNGEEGKTSQQK